MAGSYGHSIFSFLQNHTVWKAVFKLDTFLSQVGILFIRKKVRYMYTGN